MKEVTSKQLAALRVIDEYGPIMTISSISRLLRISRTAARARVNGLIKNGYIEMKDTDLVIGKYFTVIRREND